MLISFKAYLVSFGILDVTKPFKVSATSYLACYVEHMWQESCEQGKWTK
jgi:hypothetical protein